MSLSAEFFIQEGLKNEPCITDSGLRKNIEQTITMY